MLECLKLTHSPFWILAGIFFFSIAFYLNRKDKIKVFHEHPIVVVYLLGFFPAIYESVATPIILGRIMMTPGEFTCSGYLLFEMPVRGLLLILGMYAIVYFWKSGRKLLSASLLLGAVFLQTGVLDYDPRITLQANLTYCFLILSLVFLWIFMITRKYTLWQKVALFSLLIAVLLFGNVYTGVMFVGW